MSNLTTFPDARVPTDERAAGTQERARPGVAVRLLNLKMIAMVTKGHH